MPKLVKNQSLERLYLDSNTYGDEGWSALGEYIQQNRTLRMLSIGNETHLDKTVTEEGVSTFLQALKTNTSLKELHIGFKSESETWLKELADVVKVNSTLQRITLKPRSTGLKQGEVDALIQPFKLIPLYVICK